MDTTESCADRSFVNAAVAGVVRAEDIGAEVSNAAVRVAAVRAGSWDSPN